MRLISTLFTMELKSTCTTVINLRDFFLALSSHHRPNGYSFYNWCIELMLLRQTWTGSTFSDPVLL